MGHIFECINLTRTVIKACSGGSQWGINDPFRASMFCLNYPRTLYSLWTADMQTQSQQTVLFWATGSNPIMWGISRATSVPAWHEEEKEERMRQLSSKSRCDWDGLPSGWFAIEEEMRGDTAETGYLIHLPFRHSFICFFFFHPGLQDECFALRMELA